MAGIGDWLNPIGALAGAGLNAYAQSIEAKRQREHDDHQQDLQRTFLGQQGAGDRAQTAANRGETARQFDIGMGEKTREFGINEANRNQAYQQSLQNFQSGETGLMGSLSEADPLSRQVQGEKESQLQASLAQSGVRGGAAATQLRRGAGEFAGQDAQNRQALMRNYLASKAAMGQTASAGLGR